MTTTAKPKTYALLLTLDELRALDQYLDIVPGLDRPELDRVKAFVEDTIVDAQSVEADHS